MEQHYLPKRGKADKAVLSLFAQEQESRMLCYANANSTRRDQAGETMRFIEFWYAVTGRDPKWLYFDSKVTRYEELSKLNQLREAALDQSNQKIPWLQNLLVVFQYP